MTERIPLPELPEAQALFPIVPDAGPAAASAGAGGLHELRVRIPVDLHRQLLSLKVLRGRSLAETVSLALDAYFREKAAEARTEA